MADVGGECNGFVVIFTYCDVTLTTAAGETHDTLFFADFNLNDYEVAVVAAPNDPSIMSTSLGIEKFWNRIVTLAALGLLFVFLLISGIRQASQGEAQAPT